MQTKVFLTLKKPKTSLTKCKRWSDITGVPFVFDIVGTTEEAFAKYVDFVSKHSEAPLMLDAMSPKTRMAAAETR